MNNTTKYISTELAVFKDAQNWKKYFSDIIIPFIQGSVLEVGAGIGSNTPYLINKKINSLTLLEPDKSFANILKQQKTQNQFPQNCDVINGTLQDLKKDLLFDTIIYLDVLEHIENDSEEVSEIYNRLKQNGKLIILSPAFPCIFSKFDKEIGHYRRYTKKSLRKISVKMRPLNLRYLDCSGFFLSAANKYFLTQKYPSKKQVFFWDKVCIPISRFFDPLTKNFFGRSILGIWEKK
ncbi:MAG TPA: class I SAM-dependent methyltransferase [Chitinophagaceae bacterium]|jgi:2-polyprenyl-3-methyl-5-hydroxy-6-metoxy-1,4-benzoquinol methylase|nr:class I SAM-dependent methyltransferase [Chitinophagaceae bacterium]HMU58725.1 class I SAM-dependent methyltransferase [Chitinophagaceae bacterium]